LEFLLSAVFSALISARLSQCAEHGHCISCNARDVLLAGGTRRDALAAHAEPNSTDRRKGWEGNLSEVMGCVCVQRAFLEDISPARHRGEGCCTAGQQEGTEGSGAAEALQWLRSLFYGPTGLVCPFLHFWSLRDSCLFVCFSLCRRHRLQAPGVLTCILRLPGDVLCHKPRWGRVAGSSLQQAWSQYPFAGGVSSAAG